MFVHWQPQSIQISIGMAHRGSGSSGGPSDNRMSIAFLAPTRAEPVHARSGISPSDANSSGRENGTCFARPTLSHQSQRGAVPPLITHSTPVSARDEQDDYNYDDSPGSSRNGHKASPRSPRPSYTEEQKFFIMFARIVQDRSWPDIENDFAKIFGQRTKGGLTSVYYRIRKTWGLEDVLKSGASLYDVEKDAVNEKAPNFSRDFLDRIRYPVEPIS